MSEREVTAVVSDLHANARALRAALAQADATGFDHLVILGDLLTYGPDVDEVLDLVEARVAQGASLVVGNHDQLYLDLAVGERGYYDTLPPWLRETADQTFARVNAPRFAALPWRASVVRGRWWFSHANPWPLPDWRYLNTPDDAVSAAATLRAGGHTGGVFGHTHRRRAHRVGPDGSVVTAGDAFDADESAADVWVVNPGSTGQPRQADRAATFLRLTRAAGRAQGELVPVTWDVAGHVAAVRAMGLSPATTDRLVSFFVG